MSFAFELDVRLELVQADEDQRDQREAEQLHGKLAGDRVQSGWNTGGPD